MVQPVIVVTSVCCWVLFHWMDGLRFWLSIQLVDMDIWVVPSLCVCVCVCVELHGMKDLSFLGPNPRPLHWKRRALTIELPWKSQVVLRFWRCEFVSSKRLCADLYVDTCFHFSGGNTSGWDCGSQAHVWLYKKPPSSCPERLHCPASPMAFRESCHRPESF